MGELVCPHRHGHLFAATAWPMSKMGTVPLFLPFGESYEVTTMVTKEAQSPKEMPLNHWTLRFILFALALFSAATGLAYAQGSVDEPARIQTILQQAREAAAGIPVDPEAPLECDLPTKIAEAQVKAGDVEGAIQTAAGIQKDWCKRTVFMRVNEILGDAQKALKIAAGIQDDRAKSYVLLAIAESQTKAGDIQGAMQTAGGIRDDSVKSSVLMSIAWAQYETGNLEGALETVAGIQPDMSKAGTLCSIGGALARAGDQAGAAKTVEYVLQTTATIQSDREKANFLIAGARPIWGAQVQVGDRAGAARTLEQAFQAVAKIQSDIPEKAEALGVIARAQATKPIRDHIGAAKTVKQALQTVALVQESYKNKDWVLRDIAVAQAATGDIQGSVQTAAGIQGENDKGEALKAIARTQAKSGDMQGAHALAASQNSPFVKANALLGAAEGILERKDAEKPLTTATKP